MKVLIRNRYQQLLDDANNIWDYNFCFWKAQVQGENNLSF